MNLFFRAQSIILALIAHAAFAGESATRDWHSTRTKLSDIGLDFLMTYTGEVYGNPVGGVKRSAVYDGLLELNVDVDLEKLVGWSGASLHAGAILPHGASGTDKYVGDLGVFSNIDSFDTYRLYELWLQQNCFNDRVSLRLGQLDIDEDFAGSDSESLFPNSDFGNSAAFSGNFPEPTYAVLALGARLCLIPVDGFHVSLGVFDGNPGTAAGDPSPNAAASNEFNHFGTHWALRGDEGALLAAEIGWSSAEPEADKSNAPRPLAGSYKAGLLHHTDTFSNIFDAQLAELGSSLTPTRARGVSGDTIFYVVAEQEIWREPGSINDGLCVFARATFAPKDRNFFSRAYETGVIYHGLRDGDELGLGVAFTDISSRVADATRAANRHDGTRFATPDYEAVVELTYRFPITPWCSMQPDAQWIIHPGGSRAIDNALVIGLRTTIVF